MNREFFNSNGDLYILLIISSTVMARKKLKI